MSQIRLFAALAALLVFVPIAGAGEFPAWAYAVNPPAGTPVPDDGHARHVPDSSQSFVRTQLSDIAGPVCDWHPEEHPPAPAIVTIGRPSVVFACGYCHLPNGAGRPENASIAGLTPAYFKEQVFTFKQGQRPGSEPARVPQTVMIAIAQALTDEEIDTAAAYFATIARTSWLRVVETETVPKTVVAGWTLKAAPEGGTEPIGRRIIEMPEDFERFENRDSRTTYVAYVPVGSVARGKELVTNGRGNQALLCATCHGPGLTGMADVPRIAGRSPSFLMRQLHDLRTGTRGGGAAEQMKPVVAQFGDDDMLAIVAYLATLDP